jgi:CO/xanthine dehydrogenase FAD-binding subunit
VRFPIWTDGKIGVGFQEVSARRSDFAFVSTATQLALDADGICRRAAIGIGAIADAPFRLHEVEQTLIGTRPEPAKMRTAIERALAGIDINADLHASAAYRRRVAATLALRAIADACDSANKRGAHAG